MIGLRRQAKKENKYKAIKTIVDGIRFDSKKESERYINLKFLLACGAISNLEIQPRFDLIVNDVKICRYIADFRYLSIGKMVVEDCKGVLTPVYKLKKKLMKAIYNIDIIET